MYNFNDVNDQDFIELVGKEYQADFEMDINTFENDDSLELEYLKLELKGV